jgi:catechol 2,3-dioxygenase
MLPNSTHISGVHLRVSDLGKALEFYEKKLGFSVLRHDKTEAVVAAEAAEKPLLTLTEDRHAHRVVRAPGLFHVAYLFPTRRMLARAFNKLVDEQWPFQGFADHGVSEALYLADPEGNGIELYADKPRSQWRYENGELQMTTAHLNLEDLVSELKKSSADQKYQASIRVGHIHLQVSDLSKAEKFYHTLIGFEITQRNYPGALFVSAGGYHHHIGMNIWNSRGTSRPSKQLLGLQQFDVSVGEAQALDKLKQTLKSSGLEVEDRSDAFLTKDPDGIHIAFLSN